MKLFNPFLKIFILISFLFCFITFDVHAASEENIVSYSFRLDKDILGAIASDRFGDQSEDFAAEIKKKNINISNLKITHKGTKIYFDIKFNSFNIEKGDKYMIDKALQPPINEQIVLNKYMMYRMVSNEYKINDKDVEKINNIKGSKILLNKIKNEYEILFKLKFNIDLKLITKNKNMNGIIVLTNWEENELKISSNKENNIVSNNSSEISGSDDLSNTAKAYLIAQKRIKEEEKYKKENERKQKENELKKMAQLARDVQRTKEALKKYEEEKKRVEEEKKLKKEELIKKEEEDKKNKENEENILKTKLLENALKKEKEKKEKELELKEEQKKLVEKKIKEKANIIKELINVKERRYKLDEEIKLLEDQARIEYEQKKKENERKKQEELLKRENERKKEEERIRLFKLKEKEKNDKLEKNKKKEALEKKAVDEKRIKNKAMAPGGEISTIITSKKVFREPDVDGNAESAIWKNAKSYIIVLKDTKGKEKVLVISSVYTNSNIYFYLKWNDSTENLTHKTWEWNKNKKQYEVGKDNEDKLSMMFTLTKDFSSCMLEGKSYTADLWEWAAARTNPVGYADDQKILISRKKIKRANSYKAKNGKKIWIKKIFDKGEPAYKQVILVDYKFDKVPRYNKQMPNGSRADIKAKGKWKDGVWVLEMGRKMKTEDNKNDIQFDTKKGYNFAIAVFDHEIQENHFKSEDLLLNFGK